MWIIKREKRENSISHLVQKKFVQWQNVVATISFSFDFFCAGNSLDNPNIDLDQHPLHTLDGKLAWAWTTHPHQPQTVINFQTASYMCVCVCASVCVRVCVSVILEKFRKKEDKG